MAIPRLHLFELEDQPWFPPRLRRYMTDYLAEISARVRPYQAVVPLLADLLQRHRGRPVLDLCSGSGGPWPQLLPALAAARCSPELELSDAFPHPESRARFDGARVRYRAAPLRATDVPADDAAIRTLFTSFHHFRPEQARAILAAAQEAGVPIAVFEASHRSLRGLLAVTAAPLLMLLFTPWMRPRSLVRLAFTYLLPVLPLAVLWDGVVSSLRTYRPAELLVLAGGHGDGDSARYLWRTGEACARRAPLPITYILGEPRSPV